MKSFARNNETISLELTFIFLIEKEFSDKDSSIMLAEGAKSNELLLYLDWGKSYRGFLEGSIKVGTHLLLSHIINLELKSIW